MQERISLQRRAVPPQGVTSDDTRFAHLWYRGVYHRKTTATVSFLDLSIAGSALVKIRGTVPATHWQNTELPLFAHAVAARAVVRKP
jgi:hypothetical protein